uniref:Short-chain dehydrogenase/reductase 3 n=1 Tax=Strigamia maritima TaxID=126957 RepID=T1IWY1_STRMM
MDTAITIAIDIILALCSIIYHFARSLILVFLPKKKKDVSSDVVLVTGAGSGLGRLVSIEFSKLGSVLVLWDLNEKDNSETAKIIENNNNGKVFTYTCDISDKQEVYKTAEKVKTEVGKVTILINNAGIVSGKQLLLTSDHMIEKTFAVNTLAHFWTVKSFLPDMLKTKKGHIVTIASMAGYFGVGNLIDYSSSKAAAIGFNNTLAAELRANGFPEIHTTLINPFFINTGMFEGVKSRFLPILTPEKVSATIVEAILTNSREINIPKYLSVAIILKTIVPVTVGDIVHDLFYNRRFALSGTFVLLFSSKKKKNVRGDIVLVTGSAGELGRAISVQFAKLGSILVLWDVNEKDNLETAKIIETLGGKAFPYTCDLSNRNEVYKTASKVKTDVGRVTILINNAGIISCKQLLQQSDDMIEKTFAVNALANFWTVKAFLPDMQKINRGHIVTIASLSGHFGHGYLVDYSSTKSAAIGFNNALTAELRLTGHTEIKTTLVCPFNIDTQMITGLKPKLIPLLTVESVSNSVIQAVRTNTREVNLPSYFNLLMAISMVTPAAVCDIALDFLIYKKKKDVSGDVVLVTGSASGLGRATSLQLAKLGSVLVLWDVNEKDNLETAKMIDTIGGKAFPYTCDLSNKNEIYKTAEKVKTQVGKVTILINNAGIVNGNQLLKKSDDLIEKTFAVNALAHFWTVKAFLPDMLQIKRGHIVTIASIAGHFGLPYAVDYSSTKSAAIGFNNTLTAELRAIGHPEIQTTLVCPYIVKTPMATGVKSGSFIPILTTESVSNSIVESILTNTGEVVLPSYMNLLIALNTFIPISVRHIVADVVCNTYTADTYKAAFNIKTE